MLHDENSVTYGAVGVQGAVCSPSGGGEVALTVLWLRAVPFIWMTPFSLASSEKVKVSYYCTSETDLKFCNLSNLKQQTCC